MIDFLLYLLKYWVHPVGLISSSLFLALWPRLNLLEICIASLIFFCFFLDLIAAAFAFKSIPNQWLYNLGFPIQVLLIAFIYYKQFSSTTFKKYIKKGYLIFSVLYLIDLLFFQKMNQLNTYVYIPTCMLIATLSYFYLREIMDNQEIQIWKDISFWFACAMLINYTATAPLISLLTWPGISQPVWNNIYYVNNIIDCIWFLLLGIGLLWTKRQTLFSL